MKRMWLPCVLTGLFLVFAGAARAEQENKVGDVNVFLKGGIADYTGSLGKLTRSGPAFGVALNLQPTNVVGFELAYEGSRNGVGESGIAKRNGGTAMVKLGLPFVQRIKPFVAGGLGASYVSVNSLGYHNDLMEEVPMSAGLEFNSGALTAGVRATYRLLFDQDFAALANAQGEMVDGEVTLGGRF